MRYQKILSIVEEEEHQEADNAIEALAKEWLAMEARQFPSPTVADFAVICEGYVKLSTELCCCARWLAAGYLTLLHRYFLISLRSESSPKLQIRMIPLMYASRSIKDLQISRS